MVLAAAEREEAGMMKKKAFTLVELVIVVAILGVLAVVAVPTFINYFKKAKTSEATDGLNKIKEGEKSVPVERSYEPVGVIAEDENRAGESEDGGVVNETVKNRIERGADASSKDTSDEKGGQEEGPDDIREIGGMHLLELREEIPEGREMHAQDEPQAVGR